MQDRIKEHDRDIRLSRTKTSAISEHAHNTGHKPLWNEVKFIDRDLYYNTRRVKETIHIRLHPDKIKRDSGIEIPEAWMLTIKKHNNRRAVWQRTAERANHWVNKSLSEQITEWTARIEMHQLELLEKQLITAEHHALEDRAWPVDHCQKKTSSMQSKSCDLHHTWLHRETNEKLNQIQINTNLSHNMNELTSRALWFIYFFLFRYVNDGD